MYNLLYPVKDATIYEQHPFQNTGLDAILELSKTVLPSVQNSRILIQFDTDKIQQLIAAATITNNRKFFLVLHTCKATEIHARYSIKAYPLNTSWDMGTGRKHLNPTETRGVTWRSSDGTAQWIGGVWNSALESTQSFDYSTTDIEMDVTSIVEAWLAGLPNHGFIIKRTSADESSAGAHGRIEFFAKETNTVYTPTLRLAWEDADWDDSSVTQIDTVDMSISIKNLSAMYIKGSKVRLKLGVRPFAFVKQFDTHSNTTPAQIVLPRTSYYSIVDAYTNETVIPYSIYTKISCNLNGSYFNISLDNFQPERYYKIVFKVELEGQVMFYDNDHSFKVVR